MEEGFDPARVYRLENEIQGYDWGSPTAIPELLGVENPDGRPQAELWMGAHPKAPSSLLLEGRRVPLDRLIADAPEQLLGAEVVARFGPRLPFLFKVLAAARALSIQAHPNREQAIEGFARENRAGIAIDAAERNYRDDNHKPEVLCAVSEFWGMCGFRPSSLIQADLSRFDDPRLDPLRSALDGADEAKTLRDFLRLLLEMEATAVHELTARAAEQAAAMEGDRFRWVCRLTGEYPDDPGGIAPLFLNVLHLRPGEAMFLPAGELHAYLEGTGIELMANSDNVLRGGLTAKHVDIPELMRVLTFKSGRPRILSPQADGGGIYPTPTDEFRLARIVVEPQSPQDRHAVERVEILLCLEGRARIEWPGGSSGDLSLSAGQSVIVPAGVPGYRLSGAARLFRADVPPR